VQDTATIVGRNGKAISSIGAPTLALSYVPPPFNGLTFVAGSRPSGPDAVAIDEATALHQHYRVGDLVPIVTGQPVRHFRISGIARFGNAALGGATFAVFDLGTARGLFGKVGKVNLIYVAATKGTPAATLVREIHPLLPPELVVRTAQAQVDTDVQRISSQLSILTGGLLAFGFIAVFVGAFVIFNTFSITVAQRTGEFALLRALGATRSQVHRAVLTEAAAVGLIASLAGLAGGLGAAAAIRALFSGAGFNLPSAGLVLGARTVLVGLAVGVLVTVAAGLLPAWRATRVAPLEALREAAAPRPPRTGRRRAAATLPAALLAIAGLVLAFATHGSTSARLAASAAGAVMLVVAIVVLVPAIVARLSRIVSWPLERGGRIVPRLARENAARSPTRTAASASGLMIGLALVLFVTVWTYPLPEAQLDRFMFMIAVDYPSQAGGGGDPRADDGRAGRGGALGLQRRGRALLPARRRPGRRLEGRDRLRGRPRPSDAASRSGGAGLREGRRRVGRRSTRRAVPRARSEGARGHGWAALRAASRCRRHGSPRPPPPDRPLLPGARRRHLGDRPRSARPRDGQGPRGSSRREEVRLRSTERQNGETRRNDRRAQRGPLRPPFVSLRLCVFVLSVIAGLCAGARGDCECDPRPLDVVIVLDSTGSMTGALDSCKKRIQRLLELLRENAPRVRFGIVTYRDHGDEYLRKGIELTDDFPKVVSFLKAIQANGGGDTPEAVEAGLEMAYDDKEMHWDPRAKKIAILVGDAPCHDKDKPLCIELATKAKAKGIITFALSVEGSISAFKEIAQAGGGKNVDIQRTDDIARHVLALTLDRDENDFKDAFPNESATPQAAHHPNAKVPQVSDGAFVLQQLRYDGDWDPPHAHKRLLRALRERAGIDCSPDRRVVRATEEALQREPFLYVTGHGAVKLSEDDEARLKAFVEKGGTILFERCCDSDTFDKSVKELAKRLTGKELAPVSAEHAVYRSGAAIAELDHTREHGGHDYVARRPILLEVADARGKPQVLYSPVDLGCGWSGLEAGKSCALRERDALRWTVNIILYVLST